jgi:hypothetical protein
MLADTYAPLHRKSRGTRTNFLLLNYLPFSPRLGWERRNRRKLYTNCWNYLTGNRPDVRGVDAAWRKLEGALVEDAAAVKQVLKTAKVLVTGGWQSLEAIQQGLAAGKFDMVTSARTLMANPDLPGQLIMASMRGDATFAPENACSLCNNCLWKAPRHRTSCEDPDRFMSPDEREIAKHGTPDEQQVVWRAAKDRMLAADRELYRLKPDLAPGARPKFEPAPLTDEASPSAASGN